MYSTRDKIIREPACFVKWRPTWGTRNSKITKNYYNKRGERMSEQLDRIKARHRGQRGVVTKYVQDSLAAPAPLQK